MKRQTISFLLLVMCLMMFACDQTPESVIKEYESAHNNHNIERALSFYDNEIQFEITGAWIKRGKDDMRKLAEWDSTVNSNLQIEIIRMNDDTLFCTVTERNDFFAEIGIPFIRYDSVIFRIKDGLIKEIIAKPPEKLADQIQTVINDLIKWSAENNDHTIAGLFTKGEFIYSKETAKMWLSSLRRWNESKSGN